ncbi:COBW domain-containing protein [Zancudomyces culisetae]|uniref:COBW domain-containing protein n=1 Tax=Zancudomyces culisetae TaxID=1213189 RepID=A0A1R1PSE5_ZANCU|nr:COBW domain-containing protein [Zancudomyces culisetae]|eukprot:OMH83871.1 COBW domain-containing protein [Zancudomyces culisetae]
MNPNPGNIKYKEVTDVGSVPVTVFTGFLGSGKTTVIMNLLKKVDPKYNIVLLKNEFGDAETDSAIARESNLQVKEMINGCLCCVLVGQMKNALIEIKTKYNPDRIIVETSGSAFPAPIAWQIRQMKEDGFHLDSILTVIDCANFMGYEDTSYTARLQAQYTDMILMNKIELVNERQMDLVLDRVNELNTDTIKLYINREDPAYTNTSGVTGINVSPDVVFGIDTELFRLEDKDGFSNSIHANSDSTNHTHDHAHDDGHSENEVDIIQIKIKLPNPSFLSETAVEQPPTGENEKNGTKYVDDISKMIGYEYSYLINLLSSLPCEDVYRVKGVIRVSDAQKNMLELAPTTLPQTDLDADCSSAFQISPLYILNFAFGRFTLSPITNDDLKSELGDYLLKIVVLGTSLRFLYKKIVDGFNATSEQVEAKWSKRRF